VRVGETVSLRVSTPAGPADVVGVVLALAPDSLTLRRRDGRVETVAVADVQAGRVVPPPAAVTVPTDELELVAAAGWRALDEERLGDWILRASAGVTSRGNSAVVVGDPGQPVEPALAALCRWYDARGLPPRVHQHDGTRRDLVALLDVGGWSTAPPVDVMTAELGPVLRAAEGLAAPGELTAAVDESIDDAWFAAWRLEQGEHPDAARRLLANHDRAVFASYRDEAGRCVAIARAAVDGRWAGLFAVEVAPDARGRRLGALVSAAALRWAAQHGARRAYLQVGAGNAVAIELYRRLGFSRHHGYVCRTRT
jgi:GNAT superfamily N-acetyltransferase